MDNDLDQLKKVLRALVVSSPCQVDMRSLLRDYRQMVGKPLPISDFGYRDALPFLKERFNDCFIFHGEARNPVLTPILTKELKHIDKFVQNQKKNNIVKMKGKRRSVEPIQHTAVTQDPDLIVKSLNKLAIQNNHCRSPIPESPSEDWNHNRRARKSQEVEIQRHQRKSPEVEHTNLRESPEVNTQRHLRESPEVNTKRNLRETPEVNTQRHLRESPEVDVQRYQKAKRVQATYLPREDSSSNAVHSFLKRKTSLYNSQYMDGASSDNGKLSSRDSGRQTASSNSIKKGLALEELKQEVVDLVASHPEGVWCTDLLRLYRECHGRELNFGRFGFTSIISLVLMLDSLLSISRPDATGDWLLRPAQGGASGPPAPAPASAPARPRRPARACRPSCNVDPDDALPGIDFDPDVFPVDCMHFMESIPGAALGAVEPGALLDVMVGEVYSPAHFWLLRLGERFHIAMEQIMDEMTEYYSSGEGRDRYLALGAVRVGHYCSSLFDRDWHRSLIVKIIDSETVKVRHVDYGTVDRVAVRGLKPLLRRWGRLPAQAVRARLAGVRPGAAGRRWPHAASARFLDRVRDAKLVASVVAVDREEDILEVFLVNTSTDKDEDVSADLIRSGHADPRQDSSVRSGECFLFPRFEALESGATPNFAEISKYLRDGISLEYVDDYRRHVPDCLPRQAPLALPPGPSPSPSPSSDPSLLSHLTPEPASSTSCESGLSLPERSPSPPPVSLVNRVPLFPTSPVLPTEPAGAERAESARSNRSQPALSGPQTATPDPTPAAPSPPTPPPEPKSTPPAPAAPACPGGVTLSARECETFQYLSHVDPAAAHWFMVGALSRAAPSAVPLNAAAPEFRPTLEFRSTPEFRPTLEFRSRPEFRPTPEFRSKPEFRPTPEFRSKPEFRPTPAQFHPNAAAPEFKPRPILAARQTPLLPAPPPRPYPQRYPPGPQQYPPRMHYVHPAAPYGPYVPPGPFMSPPGFGPGPG